MARNGKKDSATLPRIDRFVSFVVLYTFYARGRGVGSERILENKDNGSSFAS